jgi:spore coat assembly protein
MIKINDYVSRISYNHDIIFKVISINDNNVLLEGYEKRLVASADISDLVIVDNFKILESEKVTNNRINGIKKLSRYKMHMT